MPIWTIEKTLTSTNTLGQCGDQSVNNEKPLYTNENSRTKAFQWNVV